MEVAIFYKQRGLVAPTYATLTLGYLEYKLHQKLISLWGEELAEKIKSKWKRFLDDCFILSDESEEKLEVFHKMLDEMNPNIKFAKDTSEEELPFLDVLVKKRNTRITTDIYYKVTDTHQFLHFGSCHPHQTKTSIPYNLARLYAPF